MLHVPSLASNARLRVNFTCFGFLPKPFSRRLCLQFVRLFPHSALRGWCDSVSTIANVSLFRFPRSYLWFCRDLSSVEHEHARRVEIGIFEHFTGVRLHFVPCSDKRPSMIAFSLLVRRCRRTWKVRPSTWTILVSALSSPDRLWLVLEGCTVHRLMSVSAARLCCVVFSSIGSRQGPCLSLSPPVCNTADTQRNSGTRIDASASPVVVYTLSKVKGNKPSALSQ